MQNIGDLLKRYKRFSPPDREIREALSALLSEYFEGESITRENIRVQGRVVHVSCSPILKSEIVFNKEKLLEELKRRIDPYVIDDIR